MRYRMPLATVPGGIGRATLIPLLPTEWERMGWPPYLVLLRVGFTELSMSPPRLVRSYRTVSPLPGKRRRAARRSLHDPGGLFSVALSLGLPPLDVIQHPALRSPDFPPSTRAGEERSSDLLCPARDDKNTPALPCPGSRVLLRCHGTIRLAKVRYADNAGM
jgi:hypothetical protein